MEEESVANISNVEEVKTEGGVEINNTPENTNDNKEPESKMEDESKYLSLSQVDIVSPKSIVFHCFN